MDALYRISGGEVTTIGDNLMGRRDELSQLKNAVEENISKDD